MRTEGNSKRLISLACVLASVLIPVAAAQAALIFAGGDRPFDYPAYNGIVFQKDGTPFEFFTGGPTLSEPKALAFGPNGNLFLMECEHPDDNNAADPPYDLIYEYTPGGQYVGVFVARADYGAVDLRATTNPTAEPQAMAFGPDGNLYIAMIELDETVAPFPTSDNRGMILRFDGSSGAFMDIFVANGVGNLNEPSALAFDPAGNLYVADDDHSEKGKGGPTGLKKYSPTGAFLSEVIDVDHVNPVYDESKSIVWHDGRLYVANEDEGNVLVVSFNPDGSTNTVSEFVTAGAGGLGEPKAIAFGPDGRLWVTDSENEEDDGGTGEKILRYDGTTGAFYDVFLDLETVDDTFYDPYQFVFFVEGDAIVPVLNVWSMTLLALALAGIAGFVLVRRKRRAAV